jgi:DNA-binding transcriptional ArsR family regulator
MINSPLAAAHKIDNKMIEAVRGVIPNADVLDSMSQFFCMLGEPTRLKIILVLKKSELCVHEISDTIDLSISAVSHQLRLLKSAKIVKNRRQGKHIYYALDDEHIKELLLVADEHVREG